MTLPSWIAPQDVQALAWTLIHFSWQGFLVAALLSVALWAARESSSIRRHSLALAALVFMATLPLITWPVVRANMPEQLPPQEGTLQGIRQESSGVYSQTLHSRPALTRDEPPIQPWAGWLVALWGVGALTLGLRLAGGWLAQKRLRTGAQRIGDGLPVQVAALLARRLGYRGALEIWTCEGGIAPSVVGLLKPLILLPASLANGMNTDQLEALLAHEIAHLYRRDTLINALQAIVEVALFYHPAVWWVSARLREEREACCDDLAVQITGDRAGYARALATLETMRSSSTSLAASSGNLLQRIKRLTGDPEMKTSQPVPAVLLAATAALVGLGAVNAQTAKPPKAPQSPPVVEVVVPGAPLPAKEVEGKPVIVERKVKAGKPKVAAGVKLDEPLAPRAELFEPIPVQGRPVSPGQGDRELANRVRALEQRVDELLRRLEQRRDLSVPGRPLDESAVRLERRALESTRALRAREQDLARMELERANQLYKQGLVDRTNVLQAEKELLRNKVIQDIARAEAEKLDARLRRDDLVQSRSRNQPNKTQADDAADLRRENDRLRREIDAMRRELEAVRRARPRSSGTTLPSDEAIAAPAAAIPPTRAFPTPRPSDLAIPGAAPRRSRSVDAYSIPGAPTVAAPGAAVLPPAGAPTLATPVAPAFPGRVPTAGVRTPRTASPRVDVVAPQALRARVSVPGAPVAPGRGAALPRRANTRNPVQPNPPAAKKPANNDHADPDQWPFVPKGGGELL